MLLLPGAFNSQKNNSCTPRVPMFNFVTLLNGHTTTQGHRHGIVSPWSIGHSSLSVFGEQYSDTRGLFEMHSPVSFSISCHTRCVSVLVLGLVLLQCKINWESRFSSMLEKILCKASAFIDCQVVRHHHASTFLVPVLLILSHHF